MKLITGNRRFCQDQIMKSSSYAEHVNMKRHRNSFTLIELLIVVAILLLLFSLLLPALDNARSMARRTGCLSNLRNSSLAIFSYASDNSNYLYKASNNGNYDACVPMYPGYDMRPYYKSYVMKWEIWNCPEAEVLPIDSTLNNAAQVYCNRGYFPGRMEAKPDWGGKGQPPDLITILKESPAKRVVMQDYVVYYGQTVALAPFQGSHVKSGLSRPPLLSLTSGKPSFGMWSNTTIDYAGIAFYDCHAEMRPFKTLSDVGSVNTSRTGDKVYSVLP